MNQEQVFAPFIQEIEVALKVSMARHVRAVEAGDVYAMEEESEQQKNLVTARKQLEALQVQWPRLVGTQKLAEYKPIQEPTDLPEDTEHHHSTPVEQFILPILQGLEELGGRAEAGEVMDRVGRHMAHILNAHDYGRYSSGNVRWRTATANARQNMIRRGLLAGDSPRGVWEITDRGCAYLHEKMDRMAESNAALSALPTEGHGIQVNLQAEFHEAMLDVYCVAAEHGYRATYFKRMVDDHGGLEAAKRLLAKQQVQTGLTKLWELGLLEHSTEALVLRERFHPLFTESERQEARQRLEALGFYPE